MSDNTAETVYGGSEGPNSMYVKFTSSDNQEFYIKREYALLSPKITDLLSGPHQSSETKVNEVNFRGIPSHILQILCQYLTYRARYAFCSPPIPEFPIPPELEPELLELKAFFGL